MNYLKLQFTFWWEEVMEFLCKYFHKKYYMYHCGGVRYCKKCNLFRFNK